MGVETGVELNWAALAIPIFLAATLGEVWLARKRGADAYAFGTAISDLACGSVYQAFELVFKLATLGLYAWVYEHWRLIEFAEGSVWPWVIGMLGVDLLFYWWHRVSHVVNVMWAVHGVHHQSEDYNLAVALRQPLFEPLSWFLFYVPLAFLGVDPIVYLLSYAANRFYQFWIHTELVDKWPRPLEYLLNTPSHHRVHHGVQEQYLDKNYGAILIVWDRWFGTFEPEAERPTYGTTVPIRSYNPLWANFEHLHRIWQLSTAASRKQDKWWAWFAHPAWLPEGVADPATKPDRSIYTKYRPDVSPALRRYVVIHFAITGLALGALMFFEAYLTGWQLFVAATVLVAGFVAFSGLIEDRGWALGLEYARLGAFSLTAIWLLAGAGSAGAWGVALLVLVLMGSIGLTVPWLRHRDVPTRF